MSDDPIVSDASLSEVEVKPAKRKRKSTAEDEEELEIDVNLPEPPSKKAKRKEKKTRSQSTSKGERPALESQDNVQAQAQDTTTTATSGAAKPEERSEYGIWIGNLPWTATKEVVRKFLDEQGRIDDKDITRVHMPPPRDGKAKNKGFAYVDFTTPEALARAIALSEKLLGGRKVLIKNSKSFEGRPEVKEVESGTKKIEPNKRIFVGNLGFDVGKEELREHLEQAGPVEDVFLATFEDSGMCMGFGWVRFEAVEAAEAAVRGFVRVERGGEGKAKDDEDEESSGEEEGKEKKKKKGAKTQKRFINRLNGRTLRCEFAEDAQTRYKKRYTSAGGKDDKGSRDSKPFHKSHDRSGHADGGVAQNGHAGYDVKPRRKDNADDRREHRRKRHDARTIAPGQTLANAPRASAAIVAGAGKKTSFD